MKKLISVLLTLMMVVALFAACSTTKDVSNDTKTEDVDDFSYITENKKLVIGMTDYAPMNYKDENGEWTGFDTEFALAVCEKLGVEAEFVEIDWDNKFVALKSKAIDCIWNGMTISDEVLKNTSCSKAYVKNAQVAILNKDVAAKIENVEDMADLTFAVEAGSAGAQAAADNNLNYIEAQTQTDALLEVKSGSTDGCVIDLTMAKAVIENEGSSYKDLAIAYELTSEEYGIAFRQGSNLLEKVEAIMDELKADGTLDKLAQKYELVLSEN